jgi:hypothetical protein
MTMSVTQRRASIHPITDTVQQVISSTTKHAIDHNHKYTYRTGNEPLVVKLVDGLVQQRMVERTVNPVDRKVIPHQVHEYAQRKVTPPSFLNCVVLHTHTHIQEQHNMSK